MSHRLPPLIRWPGGQSRELKKLTPYFPKHTAYVEPFAGGASFFFGKDPAQIEALGDTSPWLMKFYDSVRRGALRSCQRGVPYSLSAFRRALKSTSACSRLAVSALGFGGFLGGQKGGFDWSRRRMGTRFGTMLYGQKMKKLPSYERRLRHAFLTTGSFERTMKKFDSPSTFHLLDPPWPENHSKEYYGNDDSEVTPERVAKVVRKMKGTVWVLYNAHPAVVQAFRGRGFRIYKIRTKTLHAKRGAQQGVKLLITNRPLRRR